MNNIVDTNNKIKKLENDFEQKIKTQKFSVFWSNVEAMLLKLFLESSKSLNNKEEENE